MTVDPTGQKSKEAMEWFDSYFNCKNCRPAEGEEKRYCAIHDGWRTKLEEEGKIKPRRMAK